MAKVKSDRDLVDSGIKALVDALGYSGAARFLRHFSKGEGDYLVIQEKLFKGMDLAEIYRRPKSIIEPSNPVASLPVSLNDCRCLPCFRNSGNVESVMLAE